MCRTFDDSEEREKKSRGVPKKDPRNERRFLYLEGSHPGYIRKREVH